jgi:hypothetical protein
MSRIVVLEIPDEYELTARELLDWINYEYPDVEVLLQANFDWWRKYCANQDVIKILPLLPNKKLLDNLDEFIDSRLNPKSIEERKAEEKKV